MSPLQSAMQPVTVKETKLTNWPGEMLHWPFNLAELQLQQRKRVVALRFEQDFI